MSARIGSAHRLRRLGVGPDTPVAICLERSCELVIGLLAISKAGGAYVPLDLAFPKERLRFILDDTRAPVLLTERRLREALPEHSTRAVYLDFGPGTPDPQDDTDPPCVVDAEDLAYIMYTSGSTGTPKGVAVPHRGVVRLLFGVDYAKLEGGRTILQMAPAAFDASTFEIWGALLHGGRCVLAPGRLPAFDLLGDLLRRHEVDTVWLTATLFNAVIDEAPEILAGVRQLLIGGEALSIPHVRRALELLPATALINGYGPTEATTFACCHRIPRMLPEGLASIPIGKPIANTTIYLLDPSGRPVPIGVPGEIHIGGPGVALGYWDRPGSTAERFIPDRFGTVPGARLYRTGDLGRYLMDGDIEFLGRLDDQVKIRGFRVEPGEVEAAIRRHTAVRAVAVVAGDEPRGTGRRLIAYVVPGGDGAPTDRELRGFLSRSLPDHMVPSAVVFLDELPSSPNGKVDRRRLPSPESPRADVGRPFALPRTVAEATLVGIFAELLGCERVGVDDDFFDLGGDSLLAMRAAARARQALGVDVPLASLLATPTAASLAAACGRPVAVEPDWPPSRVDRGVASPLLASQVEYWSKTTSYPDNPRSNITRVYRLRGPLDPGTLEEALRALTGRHEALRTTFAEVRGDLAQLVGPADGPGLPRIDLGRLPAVDRLAAAMQRSGEHAGHLFDLANDGMLRPLLIRLDDEDHVLVLTFHHIALDGWSLGVFCRELSALYGAHSTGGRATLPDIPFQPVNLAAWERASFRGEAARRHLAYWKRQLGGARPPALPPGDGPRANPGDYRSLQQSIVIGADLTDSLRRLARQEGGTLSMALLAALDVLILEATGQEDISVRCQLAAHSRPESEGVIGLLRRLMVLRTDLSGRPTPRQLLRRVRDVATGAYLHMDFPLEAACPEWHPLHPSYESNPPVVFNYIECKGRDLTLPGLCLSRLQLPPEDVATFVPLVVVVIAQEKEILIQLKSRVVTYSPPKAMEHLDAFRSILRRIVAAPDRRLSGTPRRGQP